MHLKYSICTLFILLSFITVTYAQKIQGTVADAETKQPLDKVEITNVYTNATTTTDSTGAFFIPVEKGQLVEFKKMGYTTERMRIPMGNIPPTVRAFLAPKAIDLREVEMIAAQHKAKDWKTDSSRYANIYAFSLAIPRFTALDYIEHPFSAMSRRNQQAWAFQDEYNIFQHQKYIDYTFSETLVANLTGLTGDSSRAYIQKYRPTYEQLRSMSEYDLYSYISQTVYAYRTGINRRRTSIRRSSR